MKILSAKQIREADAHTIKSEPILSIDLMERASSSFCDWFVTKYENSTKVLIIAGSGNNGGDALAIARLLNQKSYYVEVYLASPKKESSPDFLVNLERLPKSISMLDSVEKANEFDLIIDGLFGSGLTRAIEGDLGVLIDKINATEKVVVSIDIASGLTCDGIASGNSIIKPTETISFQLPKLSFMLPENDIYVGNWHLVDIGLNNQFIINAFTEYNFQTQEEIASLIKPKNKFAYKGVFGHALIVGGSYGKIGANVLASKACLRSGAGLVTSLLPACGYEIIQSSVPEAMCITSGIRDLEPIELDNLEKYAAIGIGPGLGTSSPALSTMLSLIKLYNKPMVFDADALNLLAENPELLELLPKKSILTPHVGEFNRLVGGYDNSLIRLKKQKEFSKKYKLIMVLKGAHSVISDEEGNSWFNSTGNPGMATAGSGDVLTGMITALLAQNYSSINAARIGVFLHGKAGDLSKVDLGETSILASDIVERISQSFISLDPTFTKKIR